MFDAAPAAEDAVPPAPSRAEERMRLLRRMSEVGVRMAERLDRQSELCATYAEAEASPERHREPNARRLDEIARAFAQVSRAVSVSVALEDRIERGPPPPPPAERPPPALRLVEPESRSQSHLGARREQADRAVRRAIDADAAGDPRRTAELCLNLDRLLDRELAAVDAFLERPLDEIIARLSRDLGLTGCGDGATETGDDPPARASGAPASGSPGPGPREERARDARGPIRGRPFRRRLGASP